VDTIKGKPKLQIGFRIKEIRKKLGLSQGKMAEKVGIHFQTLSKYERGEQIPSYETLGMIVDKLNVNPVWLLAGPDAGDMFGPGIKNSEEVSVRTIFERIITVMGWKSHEMLAQELGFPLEQVARLTLMNELPLSSILSLCIRHRLNIEWVFTGRGQAGTPHRRKKAYSPLVEKIVDMLIDRPEEDIEDILNLMIKEILYKDLLREKKKKDKKPKN
jgi:transcriptional regulator with XRE-family HTH domain